MSKKYLVLVIIIVLVVAAGLIYLVLGMSNKTTNLTKTTATKSDLGTTKIQSTAVNNSVVITKTNSSVGQYLAEPNGQTLYTYNLDKPNISNCHGSCLSIWPAYQDKGATTGLPANISTIKRSDNGQNQFTYKGLPLYTYVGDTSPGQVNGNGVSGFYVAKP